MFIFTVEDCIAIFGLGAIFLFFLYCWALVGWGKLKDRFKRKS